MIRKPTLCLITGIAINVTQALIAQVTVEVVNDSGKPDGQVFIKVPGKTWGGLVSVTPANLFVNIDDKGVSAAAAEAVPLSTLATNNSAPPYQSVSAISAAPTPSIRSRRII
jgi:hypothetical protein